MITLIKGGNVVDPHLGTVEERDVLIEMERLLEFCPGAV